MPIEENQSVNGEEETLAESFFQARRELWIMIGTWIVFAAWVTIACWKFGNVPEEGEVPVVFGMPSWVFYGIGLPWVIATSWAIVFGARFMKDTDLEGGGGDGTSNTGR